MDQPWVYMCSPSWTPLPPSHPILQGHPSAPALSTLSHALNLDWWSISHMIIYMFQCYSLKSYHHHLRVFSLPFFKFYFYFYWRLIILQYYSGFCHTLTWISHGCTCIPHPEPRSYFPSHPIPLGHPSAPALSTLSHALNLDWRSVSHMIIYMLQCHSLKSSHPRLLPQSPKDCSLHRVSFAVSHIGSSLPSF